MIATQDITKEIYEATKRSEKGAKEIFELAKQQAETEREYRRALAHEKMRLKDTGMAMGMVDDVARGNLSELLFERDLAEARYVAGRDSIKAISTQVNALQSILKIHSEV